LITVPSNHHTLSNTNSPWIPITWCHLFPLDFQDRIYVFFTL
jgi:predicted DCC family thiol-disulfide oxidoreductase YuxK